MSELVNVTVLPDVPEPVRTPEPVEPYVRNEENFDIIAWLDKCGWPHAPPKRKGDHIVIEIDCPFKPNARTSGGAWIRQNDNDGRISAGCNHTPCQDKNWKAVRAKIDPTWDEREKEFLSHNIEDVEALARSFIDKDYE
jgi:hypothetical protein